MDSRLQSGVGGAPKWEPRSRLGIYVGHSPSHAGSVALVLNPRTGHVSPQFHVVFDDHYTTVPFMEKNEVPPHWAELVENSREKVTEENYELAQTWLFPDADPGDISMPERNQNVSGNFIGLPSNSKTISHNVPQTNSQPTDLFSLNHADLTTFSETTETSPVGDLLQRPSLPFVSNGKQYLCKQKILYRLLVSLILRQQAFDDLHDLLH